MDALLGNYLAWKPFLNEPNLLVVRYEDLLRDPVKTMFKVYEHINLPYSTRFLEPFPRLFPQRFLWETTVAQDSGINKEFDQGRISSWMTALSEDQLDPVYSNPLIIEFMERFGYETPDRQCATDQSPRPLRQPEHSGCTAVPTSVSVAEL